MILIVAPAIVALVTLLEQASFASAALCADAASRMDGKLYSIYCTYLPPNSAADAWSLKSESPDTSWFDDANANPNSVMDVKAAEEKHGITLPSESTFWQGVLNDDVESKKIQFVSNVGHTGTDPSTGRDMIEMVRNYFIYEDPNKKQFLWCQQWWTFEYTNVNNPGWYCTCKDRLANGGH